MKKALKLAVKYKHLMSVLVRSKAESLCKGSYWVWAVFFNAMLYVYIYFDGQVWLVDCCVPSSIVFKHLLIYELKYLSQNVKSVLRGRGDNFRKFKSGLEKTNFFRHAVIFSSQSSLLYSCIWMCGC